MLSIFSGFPLENKETRSLPDQLHRECTLEEDMGSNHVGVVSRGTCPKNLRNIDRFEGLFHLKMKFPKVVSPPVQSLVENKKHLPGISFWPIVLKDGSPFSFAFIWWLCPIEKNQRFVVGSSHHVL